MKFDLNVDTERLSSKKYDICIIGAGAAGITLAIYLANKGKSVLLLEGGGMQYTQKSQDIYAGESVGSNYWSNLQFARLRFFGGTTNHWTGRCMVLQSSDFDKKEYMSLSGWPIKKHDLDVYLGDALDILDIDAGVEEVKNNQIIPDFSMIDAWTEQSSPTRFGKKYLKDIEKSTKIDLFINANVTDIRLNDNNDCVKSVVVRNFNGLTVSSSSREFVLAAGAVENAKILLNCNSQIPEGIGNHSDYVGRCFMEHLNVDMGRIIADLNHPVWKYAKNGKLDLFTSDNLLNEKKIGGGVLAVQTKGEFPLYGRLKKFKEFIRDSVCVSETATDLSRMVTHLNCPGDGNVSTLLEQEPNRMSRVLLDRDVDSLGLRRIKLDWQISDFDRRTVRTLAYELGKELARLDIARLQLPEYLVENEDDYLIGGHAHQMGTTRMAANKSEGVVDKNCRVFGIDNFYIAGSSVFTTGGGVNPTLSIVQLSLRLADHLSTKEEIT